MKKNTKIIIAAVAVLFVACALLCIYLVGIPQTAEGMKSFTVDVVHSDESVKTFDYTSEAEYLGEVLLADGLIEGNESEFGLYITAVDGEEAIYEVDSSYWALYEGDDYAMQGIDQTPILDGAQYSLVYTIG